MSYQPNNSGPQGATGPQGAVGAAGAAGATGAKGDTGATPTTAATWTKYTVGFAALSAAGLTNDAELFSLPSKGVIHAVVISPTVAFAGGTIASYTLSVGIAGNLVKYCAAVNVAAAALQAPQGLIGMESVSGATSIRVAAVSTIGLLNAATQGSADVWVLQSVLP